MLHGLETEDYNSNPHPTPSLVLGHRIQGLSLGVFTQLLWFHHFGKSPEQNRTEKATGKPPSSDWL